MLVADPSWLEEHAHSVEALEAEYRDASALTAPNGLDDIQHCVTEGLRLTALGHRTLHDAFKIDGHGAYVLGSHGNWNLHFGSTRLAECRAALVR